MTRSNRRISLLPIGRLPSITPKSIAAHISGYLDLPVDILPPVKDPTHALDKKRMQYDAGILLKELESGPRFDGLKVIGVLEVDLFVPILTYVFGEAKQGGRFALVSTYRIKRNADGSAAPESTVLERAAKVALHELGHLFDLHHCMDKGCLMHFSGGLCELDETPLYFCRYCNLFLLEAVSS
jgi:archaemetzincin